MTSSDGWNPVAQQLSQTDMRLTHKAEAVPVRYGALTRSFVAVASRFGLVFILQNLEQLFGRQVAVVAQPHSEDSRDSCAEKGRVVLDVL